MMYRQSRLSPVQLQRLERGVCYLSVLGIVLSASMALAGASPDVSVLPLGTTGVVPGSMEREFRLPQDAFGPILQPMVFIVAQPWHDFPVTAPHANLGDTERKQVSATLTFTVAGKKLPTWELKPFPTAYVINVATLKANPKYASGVLSFTIDLQSQAEGLNMAAYGMPDPLLLDETTDGPLADLAASAKDPDVKAYLSAMVDEFTGKKAEARAVYQRLLGSSNSKVAALARRADRLMRYEFRPRKLSGNLNEHERWAMFLQQCGLFGAALTEWNECRIIDSSNAEAQYKCGEVADRLSMPAQTVFSHMARSAGARQGYISNNWHVLVAMLDNRAGKKLSSSDVAEIKNHFLIAQGMIWSATSGQIRLIPSFLQISDPAEWSYQFRSGGIYGPGDSIVADRGWFDAVYSVVPQVEGQEPIVVSTVGGDEGPNGAAMTVLPHNTTWTAIVEAFYQQYLWAARAGEASSVIPDAESALACGPQPGANRGYAFRSALKYGCVEAMHHRVKVTDLSVPDTSLRMWSIRGPFPVKEPAPTDGKPAHHVLDPIPSGGDTLKIVSDTDFVDLARLFSNTGWARAVATCWVYSPNDQEVRMWLGQNDGLALWLNGECIHRGDYYSSGKYEDRNLVDTVCGFANLRKGWNELRAVIESWPAPRNRGWGFSVRFCDWNNQPLPGLAYNYVPPTEDLAPPWAAPEVGRHYVWDDVKSDFLSRLPKLGEAEFETITGVRGLGVCGEVQGPRGYVAMLAGDRKDGPGYRAVRSAWRMDADSDSKLNNVMDVRRESVAAFRYTRDGKHRDLLLMRVDAVPTFLRLLNEPASVKQTFAAASPDQRILGYALVRTGESTTPYIVADTRLSDTAEWPMEEEDILNPIAPVYIPNPWVVKKTMMPPSEAKP
ncbi:MAG: hypothetical protein HZA51_08295 [Planctomycetes bacterium]|nr:hypothetical protein [Planctomycetota bacterium]